MTTQAPAVQDPVGYGGRPPHNPAEARSAPGWLGRTRMWLGSALAAFLGLLPHLLHHAGPLAGAALFAGVAGSLLFGAVGMVAAIPFMLRLHRSSGSWRRPAVAMALFIVAFSVSAFVIGPALNKGSENSSDSATPAPAAQPDGSSTPTERESTHESHH